MTQENQLAFFNKVLEDFDLAEIYVQYKNISDRIAYFSNLFIGKPYLAGAQGEGLGVDDEPPLCRFDCFDCVTYVNNVLALSISRSPSEFMKNLLRINYYDGNPTFENRFHFMSCDWNPQNQKNKIVRDVTKGILDIDGRSLAVEAIGDIDKPSWYQFQKRSVPQSAMVERARISYVPLSELFDQSGNADLFVFSQIPNAAVIEIVRPNWDLRDKIGTCLHVSHLGFAIKKTSEEICFRHASSEAGRVVEAPLYEYLKQYIKSETVKGISVLTSAK